MSIAKSVSSDGNTLMLTIAGRFDFSMQRDFRDAYESEGKNMKAYVVDLKGVEFMDSSACGMLLVLKDYIGGDGKRINIRNANEDVSKTMKMIQFDSLFNIS